MGPTVQLFGVYLWLSRWSKNQSFRCRRQERIPFPWGQIDSMSAGTQMREHLSAPLSLSGSHYVSRTAKPNEVKPSPLLLRVTSPSPCSFCFCLPRLTLFKVETGFQKATTMWGCSRNPTVTTCFSIILKFKPVVTEVSIGGLLEFSEHLLLLPPQS